jgi:drug/metabolite transporter (DMT)-like permease
LYVPRLSFRAKTIIAFAVVYVVWGSTYLGIKVALNEGMPSALLGASRLLLAGVLLLAFARLRGTRLAISRHDLSTSAIVGLCLLCGGMFSTMLSEQLIDSSLAAIVVAAAPLWMALAEGFIPGMDRPSRRGLAGLVIGLVGLIVLVGPRIGGLSGTPAELLGIGIQVIGTWLWVGGSILSKKRPLTADGTVATGYEMLIAGAVLTGLSLVLGEMGHARFTATGIWATLYLAVIGSAVAFTAFMWLIRNVRGSTVMTYAYVNPAVAVALGYLAGIVGLLPKPETLDVWSLAGTLVILGGVALTTSTPSPPSASSGAPRREPIAPSPDELPETPAS